MTIEPGYYTAKAVTGQLGMTGTGKEQVAVEFELTDEAMKGQRITWYGYFTDKTEGRTVESLLYAGWDGEDITVLEGLGTKEITLVIENDTWEGKTSPKVQWVNKRSSGPAIKNPMNDEQKKVFAARMKATAAAVKATVAVDDDDIPF